MRYALLPMLALLLCACDDDTDDTGPARQEGTGDAAMVAQPDGGRAELPDVGGEPEPVPDGSQWVLVNDLFEGLSIGDGVGTDVDAVEFRCPDGRGGFAVAAEGIRKGAALDFPVDGGLGPPDGPCRPLADCAALLGPRGWLAFEVETGSLSGCEVTIHEVADDDDERFEVYVCPEPTFELHCSGPHFNGTDGQAARGTIP